MTPNGQPATQVPHPLQTSACTTTVPNSVRNSAPVGHTSRQPAWVQCLHTSDDISQRNSGVSGGAVSAGAASGRGRVDGLRGAHPRHAEVDQGASGLLGLLDAVASLLDEGDVPPGAGAERAGVVVGRPEQFQVAVARVVVPLLAGHLAGLAADADRGVGEEALARLDVRPPCVGRWVGRSGQLRHQPSPFRWLDPGAGSTISRAGSVIRSLSVAMVVTGADLVLRRPGGAAPRPAAGVPGGCRRTRPWTPGSARWGRA